MAGDPARLRGPARHRSDHPRAVPGAGDRAADATPHATSWKFTLRDGAKWHDGQPVTADDVVFTFERILDPTANVLISNFFRSWLKEVKKIDDKTVELVFNFPFPDALQRLSIAKIMPKHVFGSPAPGTRPRPARRSAPGPTSRPRTTRSRTPPSRRSPTTTGRARRRSRR